LCDAIAADLNRTRRRTAIAASGVAWRWIALFAGLEYAIATHGFGETGLTATVTADRVAIVTLFARLRDPVAARLDLTADRAAVIVDRHADPTAGARRTIQGRACRVGWR
jgi:hypothetical protein